MIDRITKSKWGMLLLLITLGLGVRLYISWMDVTTLLKFVPDDAYIYFKLASNIVSGKGSTFDGLTPTNGFHPLWLLMLMPLFRLSSPDLELPIHLSLSLASLLNVFTAIFIFRIVELAGGKPRWAMIACAIWLFNPFIILIALSGVEVSLYVFFAALTIYWWFSTKLQGGFSYVRIATLGIVTGFTILSRTDAIFLFIAILIDLVWQGFKKRHELSRTFLIFHVLAYILSVGVIIGPWFFWNVSKFHMIYQSSGQAIAYRHHTLFLDAQDTGGFLLFIKLLLLLLLHLYETVPLFLDIVLADYIFSALVFGAIIGMIVVVMRDNRMSIIDTIKASHPLRGLSFALLFAILVCLFYPLYLWNFQKWYFLSAALVAIVYLGIVASLISDAVVPRLRWLVVVSAFLFLVFLGKGAYMWMKGSFFPHQIHMYEAAKLLAENEHDYEGTFGAFNAGIYGYYSNRTVINLDGVVNNDALHAIQKRQLYSYIRSKDINYLIDYQSSVERYSPFMGVDTATKFTIVRVFLGTWWRNSNLVILRVDRK